MALPTGEADLWLRKNIVQITDPETNAVGYEANEAYMRTNATEDEVAADFEGFYETAAAWQPPQPEKKPRTPEERIEALEKAIENMEQGGTPGAPGADLFEIKKDIATLKEELQAARIILGVE